MEEVTEFNGLSFKNNLENALKTVEKMVNDLTKSLEHAAKTNNALGSDAADIERQEKLFAKIKKTFK